MQRQRQSTGTRPSTHRGYFQQSQVKLMQARYPTSPFFQNRKVSKGEGLAAGSILLSHSFRQGARQVYTEEKQRREGQSGDNEMRRTKRNHRKQKPWEES